MTPAAGDRPAAAPGSEDERLRLLARALIETAVQVHEAIHGANGSQSAAILLGDQSQDELGAAASRYPPTPRGCRPAQRQRRQPRTPAEADDE